jgi:hypothetical protein
MIEADTGKRHDGSHKLCCRPKGRRTPDLPEDITRLGGVENANGGVARGGELAPYLENPGTRAGESKRPRQPCLRRVAIEAGGEVLSTQIPCQGGTGRLTSRIEVGSRQVLLGLHGCGVGNVLRPVNRPVRGPGHTRDGIAWAHSEIAIDDGAAGVRDRLAGQDRETGGRTQSWRCGRGRRHQRHAEGQGRDSGEQG